MENLIFKEFCKYEAETDCENFANTETDFKGFANMETDFEDFTKNETNLQIRDRF